MTPAWTLFAVLTVVLVADAVITAIALRRRGIREGNSVVARLMVRFGIVPTLVVLTLVSTGLTLVFVLLAPEYWWLMLLPIAWRGYVLANNVRVVWG
jgi:hypothetical protein